jgi:hypothetical protein
MILNFTQKFPFGKQKQTFFRDKVVNSLIGKTNRTEPIVDYTLNKNWYVSIIGTTSIIAKPKIHTIRHDQNNRWKSGMMIDFFINARTKKMFRFAPRVPVKSLQRISFTWTDKPKDFQVFGTPLDRVCIIVIDYAIYGDAYFYNGKLISYTERIEDLAINDGFDSVEDFFQWFNEDFIGKLIHWTDLKY